MHDATATRAALKRQANRETGRDGDNVLGLFEVASEPTAEESRLPILFHRLYL